MPSIDTTAVHAGEPRPGIDGAVVLPIFQTAMYEYDTGGGTRDPVRYIRLSNSPNHVALHAKLAALENAQAALVTASGMAATSCALLSVLKAGDHLLAQNSLYGGSYDFIHRDLPRLGIAFDLLDGDKPETWKAKLRPTTRALWVESITNPLMQVMDLPAAVAFCREHRLVSMIDNTFPSPVNFRPLDAGFDLVMHSATKYLSGHSDIVAGALCGSTDLIHNCAELLKHLGGTLDPHACFLLHRGVKTMPLRVRRQNESALKVARFLGQHPAIARVSYPGLETHPDHRRARSLFVEKNPGGGFGGMLSFELNRADSAERFLHTLAIPLHAPSLGGVESLVVRPALTSHRDLSPDQRRRMGISDSLIRMSIGIEDPNDLIADLEQALAAAS